MKNQLKIRDIKFYHDPDDTGVACPSSYKMAQVSCHANNLDINDLKRLIKAVVTENKTLAVLSMRIKMSEKSLLA